MDNLLHYITEQEAVAVLQALVRAPTVNPPGETTAAVREIARRLDEARVAYQVLSKRPGVDNLVAYLEGRRSGAVLVLNGHLDVVPPGKDWTVDPFAATVRDGKLYGRGACDMKGGLAAMLLALLALKRAGAPFAGEVLFEAVADEESGGWLGTRYLLEQGIGVGADFAIVGEPSDLRLDLGNRGIAWFEITVRGRAGHSARPRSGISAIEYAARLVTAISNLRFSRQNSLFEVPTPSMVVTLIRGGVRENIIPDTCVLTADRRLLPGETVESATAELEYLIADLPQPGITATVRCTNSAEPYLIRREEPVVQALARAHERVLGVPPVYGAKGGATDGAYLYHEGGVPTVLYGPGLVGVAHAADEHVAIESVVQAAKVYALTALDLLSGAA